MTAGCVVPYGYSVFLNGVSVARQVRVSSALNAIENVLTFKRVECILSALERVGAEGRYVINANEFRCKNASVEVKSSSYHPL